MFTASGKYNLPEIAKQTGNEDKISLLCLDQLNNATDQFDVAQAKMGKAECMP